MCGGALCEEMEEGVMMNDRERDRSRGGGRGSERDPYAPPRSGAEVSRGMRREGTRERSQRDKELRRVGAGCVGFVLVSSLLWGLSGDLLVRLLAGVVWGLLMVAFLKGGKRSLVVLCLFLLMCVAVNGYFLVTVYENTKVGGSRVVMELGRRFVPTAVCLWGALACAVMLCVRGWKRG